MTNPNIGEVACPICKTKAHVRKMSKGQGLLYLACNGCGHIAPRLAGGQDWILSNATLYGPDGPPNNSPEVVPREAPAIRPAPPVEKPRRPLLDFY